jgi:hypothetical protein
LVGLAVITVSGGLFGPVGTVVAAVIGSATLALYLGRTVISSTRALLALTLAPVILASGVIAAGQRGVDLLERPNADQVVQSTQSSAVPDGLPVLDLTDRIIDAAAVKGRSLRRAELRGAHLNGANLAGVDLRDADLRDADLRGADLEKADLRGACLDRADLSGARLTDVKALGAHMAFVTTSETEGLLDRGWPLVGRATVCPR